MWYVIYHSHGIAATVETAYLCNRYSLIFGMTHINDNKKEL